MSAPQDLTGQRFTRLVVVSREGFKDGQSAWAVICDCGARKVVPYSSLKYGRTKSCGCIRREVSRAHTQNLATHRKSGTPLYRLWAGIKTRTSNWRSKQYRNYGGRGIGMYKAWEDDFEAFEAYILANLGPRPAGKSLDRRDNEKGYEPGNLRWATQAEQSRNTRRTVWVAYDGGVIVLKDLAKRLGVDPSTVRTRLNDELKYVGEG